MKNKQNSRVVCENRKARHDYFINDTFEAGLELRGTEVKSLRAGKANLKDSFAEVKHGELIVNNLHISPYDQGSYNNSDPLRPKRLLMHRAEINKLFAKTRDKGMTLIPLKIYFKRDLAKVELALCTGKHTYDKRAALAEREAKRDIDRALKDANR